MNPNRFARPPCLAASSWRGTVGSVGSVPATDRGCDKRHLTSAFSLAQRPGCASQPSISISIATLLGKFSPLLPPAHPPPAGPPRKQACAEKAQPNNRLHLYTCSNTTLPWFYRRAIAFGPASLSLCFSFALLQSPTRCPAQRKQTRPVTAVAGSHRRTSPPRVTLSRLATSTNLNVISLKRL
jgi:hypothetical protein